MSKSRFLLGLGGIALLTACAQLAPPTRYYTLAALDPAPAAEPAAPTARGKPLVVGIGPMAFADYLERPQIVTRSSSMELELHEFDLWVEALETIFPRTLGENLGSLLGTDRVVLMPAPREVRLDYQVEVDVLRFDAMRPGEVILDAAWRVYGRDGERLVRDGRSRIARPVAPPEADTADAALADPGAEMPAVVAAMSEATVELSREIAAAIQSGRR
jgi:uncharacterized lipoprotein YmbA